MASVNKVILVGNLGRDPEMRYTPDGLAVCTISIATTSSWIDRSTGEKKQDTEWHRVVLYNRLAEVAEQYLKKGSSVYIEGRLKTRKWQDKETGQDKYATDIICDQMQMLGGKSDNNDFDSPTPTPSSPPRAQAQTQSSSARQYQDAKDGVTKPSPAPSFANIDDDIPF